jgi:hypothetical protein
MTDIKANVAALMALLPAGFSVENLGQRLGEKPCQNTLTMLGVCAALFYLSERTENPKVNDIFDALEYCSSSLSVGYTDIYPETPLGKLVATVLMTFGPSMVSRVAAEPEKSDVTQQQILATLQEILTHLKGEPQVNGDPRGVELG